MPRTLSGAALAATLILACQPSASVADEGAAGAAVGANRAKTGAAQVTSEQSESYSLGLLLGSQLATNGLAPRISRAALLRGIDAGLGGKIPSAAQKDSAQQFIHTSRAALADRNAEQAKRFLEKNLHNSGVQTLPAGLQYRVLAAGDPAAPPPGPRDQVTLRYRASLADGTEIDRSDDHGQAATFRLNSVIQGWREALSAMRPGAKWQVFVPPELGYGMNSPPPIPPGALMIYELELLKVEPATNPLSAPGTAAGSTPARPAGPKTEVSPDTAAPK
ncbi:MAG: FKBP-type peptidyl-prolyl cis-trans isomerase [Gammaproteobacteria bacterium]|nr:FKBP-type peptidyl-prolyl cis-trans isomerase [Gammaproteobacteria bacterium]